MHCMLEDRVTTGTQDNMLHDIPWWHGPVGSGRNSISSVQSTQLTKELFVRLSRTGRL